MRKRIVYLFKRVLFVPSVSYIAYTKPFSPYTCSKKIFSRYVRHYTIRGIILWRPMRVKINARDIILARIDAAQRNVFPVTESVFLFGTSYIRIFPVYLPQSRDPYSPEVAEVCTWQTSAIVRSLMKLAWLRQLLSRIFQIASRHFNHEREQLIQLAVSTMETSAPYQTL